MNIITGYISATEGSVKVDGYDILDDPEEVKSRIGICLSYHHYMAT